MLLLHQKEFELVQKAQIQRAAQRELLDFLFEEVRTTVWYIAGGDSDYDDMVQMSLMEILDSLASFKGESSIKTWAFRITVRRCMRHLKKRKRRRFLYLKWKQEPENSLPAVEKSAGVSRLKEKIIDLFQELPPERRIVLILRFVYQYKLKEIAEIVDSPLNTVKDRLKKGKKSLQKLMKKDSSIQEWIGSI
jgi:RNA polymerase sigma-70 factor (ECF subfamily)